MERSSEKFDGSIGEISDADKHKSGFFEKPDLSEA
jgi:hypothetical protein